MRQKQRRPAPPFGEDDRARRNFCGQAGSGGILRQQRNAAQAAPTAGILPHDYARRAPIQRQIDRVCRFPRLAGELLDELARLEGVGGTILALLERYSKLSFEDLAVVGGLSWPQPPTRALK